MVAVSREETLVVGLDGRDGRVLELGHADELPGAADGALRHVQVVAHQVKEALPADELAPAQHRMAVAARIALRDKAHAIAQRAARAGVGGLVARAYHHAKLLDASGGGFLENDLQGGFRFALLVDQHLQGQFALPGIGRSDEGFSDFHGGGGGAAEPPPEVGPGPGQCQG